MDSHDLTNKQRKKSTPLGEPRTLSIPNDLFFQSSRVGRNRAFDLADERSDDWVKEVDLSR
jgi:hypothetical protein